MARSLDILTLLSGAHAPPRTIAWRRGESVTEQQWVMRVRAWRSLLRRVSGRAFALYHRDAVEFAAALFGAWHAGKMIYLPGDNLPGTCASLRPQVDGYLGEFDSQWAPLAPAEAASTEELECFERLDADFFGLVLFTSGSTGAPQAIPKKLAQMAAEVSTLEKQFGALLAGAEIASTVSHQHIYGLLFKILWPLAAARAIHIQEFSFLEELTILNRDCVWVSSPAHLKRLPGNPAWPAAARMLRAVFSSGGPLPFEVAQHCARLLGQLPIEVYGSSETGGIAWRRQNAANQAWTVFSGVDWRIDAENEVLEVRSPNLPDREWFRTADRAARAGDDGFVLRRRVDRIAKIEGKRISLIAIEALLSRSPLVTSVRVLVFEGRRQRIAAFVVLSEQGRRELAAFGKLAVNRALRRALSDSVEAALLPRIWRYLDSLPVNAQGKTTYAELAALVGGERPRRTEPRRRLIEKSAEHAIYELIAPSDLLYFEGHFPGQPILPGVVQLDWVIGCGRECFDLPPRFRAVHGLKFHRVIAPETRFILEIDHRTENSSMFFKITSALGTHASGRVLFEAPRV